MADKKSPSLLRTLTPAVDLYDADHLSYPDLKTVIDEFYTHDYENFQSELWDVSNHIAVAPDSHHKHLLLTAHKLQQAVTHDDKELWSQRYTNASVALYGRPKHQEVATLARSELEYLTHACSHLSEYDQQSDNLLKVYNSLAKLANNHTSAGSDIDAVSVQLLPRVESFFDRNYTEVLRCFKGSQPGDLLTIDAVYSLYGNALTELVKKDVSWSEWSLAWRSGVGFSVSPGKKIIQIGRSTPSLTMKKCRSLFVHEALVHAQRSINGAKYDPVLATGMPGYLPAEEGLAILTESSFLGYLPHRVKDRYVDIALALGMHGERPMSRPELFALAFTRAVARAKNEEQTIDEPAIRRIVWQHVNRLYRGTLGNQYVGVFTRDIVYYDGLKEVITFINNSPKGTDEVLDFLLQGKFHPCIDEHVEYIRNVMNR